MTQVRQVYISRPDPQVVTTSPDTMKTTLVLLLGLCAYVSSQSYNSYNSGGIDNLPGSGSGLLGVGGAGIHRPGGINSGGGGAINFPGQGHRGQGGHGGQVGGQAGGHSNAVVGCTSRSQCPVGGGESNVQYLRACKPYIAPYVHHSSSGSDYHFSWCQDGGQKYDWSGARGYCKSLGNAWYPINIQNSQENYFVTTVVENHLLPYIWTGGSRKSPNLPFYWSDGSALTFYNWGTIGRNGPQPDNADGQENCLSILNHFYHGDTTTWHDIECHHRKPVICERPFYREGGNTYQG